MPRSTKNEGEYNDGGGGLDSGLAAGGCVHEKLDWREKLDWLICKGFVKPFGRPGKVGLVEKVGLAHI